MKRAIVLILFCGSLLAAADQTFTGVITDAMCGKSHEMMGSQSPEKCVAMCVKASSQFALYDGKNVYLLSDQRTPAKFAAKKVKVTGTLNPKNNTIRVASMEEN